MDIAGNVDVTRLPKEALSMPNDNTPSQYTRIAQSPKFRALLEDKKRFLVPLSIFFFVFYFTLPIMTGYVPAINHRVIGAITWAWLFAFAQFVMIWALCALYVRRAARFDQSVQALVREEGQGDVDA